MMDHIFFPKSIFLSNSFSILYFFLPSQISYSFSRNYYFIIISNIIICLLIHDEFNLSIFFSSFYFIKLKFYSITIELKWKNFSSKFDFLYFILCRHFLKCTCVCVPVNSEELITFKLSFCSVGKILLFFFNTFWSMFVCLFVGTCVLFKRIEKYLDPQEFFKSFASISSSFLIFGLFKNRFDSIELQKQ